MPNLLRLYEMIQMASYDEERGNDRALRYYRSDYVALRMITTAICTTVSYVLILGLIAAGNAEELLAYAGRFNLPALVTLLVVLYLVLTGIWLLLTLVLSIHRYNKAAERLGAYKRHLGNLKDLQG